MAIYIRKSYIAERFGISRRTVDRVLRYMRESGNYRGSERQVLNRVEIDIEAFEDAMGRRG